MEMTYNWPTLQHFRHWIRTVGGAYSSQKERSREEDRMASKSKEQWIEDKALALKAISKALEILSDGEYYDHPTEDEERDLMYEKVYVLYYDLKK